MRYKQLVILFAIFFLENQAAYGQAKTATSPPADGKTTVDEPGIENPKTPPAPYKKSSDWSFFYQMFRNGSKLSNLKFEVGTAIYSASYDFWKFSRVEPFVKLRWAILDKYLQLFTIISLDYSSIDYELSRFEASGMDISLNANLKSQGSYTFGGGVQLFLFGWRKLNMSAYVQMQSTSQNDASLEAVMLSVDKTDFNILKEVRDYIDITYSFRRYDCGGVLSYQFFSWFTVSATAGYINIQANIKIMLKPDLENAIRKVTGIYDRRLIPNRLTIDEGSAFGMLALKFRIYKSLHINLEGTILPAKNPVYYGMASFSFE